MQVNFIEFLSLPERIRLFSGLRFSGRALSSMLWFRTVSLGVKSLWLHPLRSLLTVLGIFIGVASVIWLLAISEGISREAQRQIESLGADTIMIRSVKPPSEKLNPQGVTPYGLTRDEYDMLQLTVPTIKSTSQFAKFAGRFPTRIAWSTVAWSAAHPSTRKSRVW